MQLSLLPSSAIMSHPATLPARKSTLHEWRLHTSAITKTDNLWIVAWLNWRSLHLFPEPSTDLQCSFLSAFDI